MNFEEILFQINLRAILILILGIFFAKIFEILVLKFFRKIRFQEALKRVGFEEMLERFWKKIDLGNFFAQIFKIFVLILTLMIFFETLNFERLSGIFETIVNYFLSSIFLSILIFVIGIYLLDFSKKVFIGTLEREKISFAPLVGKGFSFFFWTLLILIILYQLKIVPNLISAIFLGFVAAISLALGISFGLAGKDFAQKILKEFEEKLKK